MRQRERGAHIQVTLETSVRRLSRIDDRARAASSLDVQTAGPVARLAAHVLCVFSFCLQPRMSGCPEVAHNLFMAGRAFLRADELRAGNAGRSKNCAARRTAGKQNYRERHCSPSPP